MRSALVVAAMGLVGCSLVLDYGDEKKGRPCDATSRCLGGFVCEAAVCVEAPACRVTTDCVSPRGCKAGLCQSTPDIGDLCTVSEDCYLTETCFSASGRGSLCSRACFGNDCPTGSHCAQALRQTDGGMSSLCLRDCASDTDCRRMDHACVQTDGVGNKECLPR